MILFMMARWVLIGAAWIYWNKLIGWAFKGNPKKIKKARTHRHLVAVVLGLIEILAFYNHIN